MRGLEMNTTRIRMAGLLSALLLLAACRPGGGDAEVGSFPEFRGDAAAVSLAVADWVARGPEAVSELRAGLESDSVQVRAGCRRALGLITGQWGGGAGLVWKRSVAEAVDDTKPLMVLHLFGNFDEEFC